MAKLFITDDTKARTKAELEKHLENLKEELKEWESVKRVYKKDGKSFDTLAKNFENGGVFYEYGSNKFGIKKSYESNGRKKTYILQQPTPVYIDITGDNEKDIRHITQKIEEQKAIITRGIESTEKQLNNFEVDIARANNTLAKIENMLDENVDGVYMGTSVYYLLKEELKKYFRKSL